jgi:ABC-type transport system substrate-binding protein
LTTICTVTIGPAILTGRRLGRRRSNHREWGILMRTRIAGRTVTAALLVAALGLAAACGDDDDDASPAASSEPSPDESSAPGTTPASDAPTSAPTSEAGAPVQGGEITVLHPTDSSSLDPVSGNSGNDHMSLYPMFDRLLNFEPETLEPTPGLATAWEQPDPETLVLQLQEGVTFHDGTPFDAEAVAYNLERALTLDTSTVKADIAMIESVEATGPLEVTIHMNRPDASLLLILADRPGMMVSPTAAEAAGPEFGREPVGTGPFKFVEWLTGDRLVVEKNPDYWQEGKPYLDRITFRYLTDQQTVTNALRTNEADVALKFAASEVETLDVADIDVEVHPSLGTTVCYFNYSRPPFDDARVRRAVSFAVDRDAINQVLAFGLAQPASQVFPPGYWAADPELADTFTLDLDQARELLADAGLADGLSIRGLTYTGTAQTRLMEVMQAQLAEIGIDMSVETMEVGSATSRFFEDLGYDMYCAGWSGRPDPSQTANSLFAPDAFYNAGKYESPGMAEALEEAGATLGQDARAEAFSEVVRLTQEDALLLPLLHQPDITAVYDHIGGFVPNLYGKVDVSFLWRTS